MTLPSDIFDPSDEPKDRYDVLAHVEKIKALSAAYPIRTDEQLEKRVFDITGRIFRAVTPELSEEVVESIYDTIHALYKENNIKHDNVAALAHVSKEKMLELALGFKDMLSTTEALLQPTRPDIADECMFQLFTTFIKEYAPPGVYHPRGSQLIHLFDATKNFAHVVPWVYGKIGMARVNGKSVFKNTIEKMLLLATRASGYSSLENMQTIDNLVWPPQTKFGRAEIVSRYLDGTPWEQFFAQLLPFPVRDRDFGEHCLVCAGAGWGKTQLLQGMVLDFLSRDDPPSLIVMDSTGAMVDRIQRLALFEGKLKDRILIIDPEHSPSLNIFDLSTPRFAQYTEGEREQLQSEIVDLFSYIFASKDYEISGQMDLAFQYAVRLMLSRGNATLIDLRKLLEEPCPKGGHGYEHSAFKADIDKLDEDTRDFFRHHFFADGLKGTRASVARRIHNLMAVPAFRRMFASSANTLDLFGELQRGVICLVNTNAQLLKEDGHILFGRYIIARALAAAYERATIKDPAKRKQAFLIIDEASAYTDDKIETLLTKVRQFKLGVTLCYQHLEHKELNDNVRSALYSSTAVKYVGGASYTDRRRLAREMETTEEFIADQHRDDADPPQWTKFAVHVRNSRSAASVVIPFYRLENEPKMSDAAHAAMIARNKERVSSIATPTPAALTVLTPLPKAEPTPEPKQLSLLPNPQDDSDEPGVY